MENDIIIQRGKNWKRKVMLSLIVIVALALAGVLVWNIIPRDYDKVNVTNAEELLTKVGNEELNNFRQELLNLLRGNGVIGEDETVDDVVVREGTVVSSTDTYREDEYWKTTTFLVDIDSIKQTYSVKIVESDENMEGVTAQIYCPKLSESKYPESKCSGLYYSDNSSIEYRLPYEMKLESGEKVLVKALDTVKKQGRWKNIVQVYLYSCDENNPPVSETEKMVRKWVDEVGDGFKDYYTYNIRTGYCEGDAI